MGGVYIRWPHTLRGLALAYRGRQAEALRAAHRALALTDPGNLFDRPFFELHLARVHMIGRDHEAALKQLKLLMSRPTLMTRGLLRLDPAWAPLKENPRFEKLLREDR